MANPATTQPAAAPDQFHADDPRAAAGDADDPAEPAPAVGPPHEHPDPLSIYIDREHHTTAIDIESLRAHTRAAITEIDRPLHRLSIRIITDEQMCDLHRQFSNDDSTTDVLTFPATDATDHIDADIAICLDQAARQSAARDHCINHELLLYIIHGILHCIGYDDHTKADYAAMHTEEDRILRAIGVGALFHDEEPSP